jgi:hypothetical protein
MDSRDAVVSRFVELQTEMGHGTLTARLGRQEVEYAG